MHIKKSYCTLPLLSIFLIIISACSSSEDCKENVKEDCICITLYDPVCGCNDVTYGNQCEANCAGITNTSKGACKVDDGFIKKDWAFIGYKSEDKITDDATKKHKYSITAKFTNSTDNLKIVEGNAAINLYAGNYQVRSNSNNKGKITITGFLTTKRGGASEDINYESTYTRRLSSVDSYQLKSSNLLYLNFTYEGKSDIMIFVAVK